MIGKNSQKKYKQKKIFIELALIILFLLFALLIVSIHILNIPIINKVHLLSFEDSYKNLLKSLVINEGNNNGTVYLYDTPFMYSTSIVMISKILNIEIFDSMLLINIFFIIIFLLLWILLIKKISNLSVALLSSLLFILNSWVVLLSIEPIRMIQIIFFLFVLFLF